MVELVLGFIALTAIVVIPISITVTAKAFASLQTVGGQPVDVIKQQNQLSADLQREAQESQRKLLEERWKMRTNSLGD